VKECHIGLQSTITQLASCQEWSEELENTWNAIAHVENAQYAIVQMMGLTRARREAVAGVAPASMEFVKLSTELEVRLSNLQEVAGAVLGERLQQAEDF